MAKSMGLNMAAGLQGMLKEGHKHIDGVDDAVVKNLEAATAISKITSSSMGPNGMNKLVINHLDKILVTSDAATILQEMEVMHPAAKMLVMGAAMQEREVGDGTNFVVTFAGELLHKAENLLRMGLHTSEIVAGYKLAYDKACEILETLPCYTVTDIHDMEQVQFAIKSVIMSKHYGYEDMLSKFVAEACLQVLPPKGKVPKINVDNVRVCKMKGGSIHDSEVIKGMVVTRDTMGNVKMVENAKVAVFGCGIEASATEAKATVLIKDATELKNYNKSEEAMMEDAIRGIAESGAKVLIAGGTISEMAMHFIQRYKMMAIKIMSKFELRRLCRATGAKAVMRLGAPTPDEMGSCDKVYVKEIGDRKVTIFEQDKEESRVSTIILRASTENLLNDLERAIDDGVNTIKAICKEPRFVPGAGATEIEVARQLHALGEANPGLEQYSIKAFSQALEVVPRILAENSGQAATDIISSLYAAHAAGDTKIGVEIESPGGVKNKADDGIIDNLATKRGAMDLAVDAAQTVLRVDCIIMSKAAGGPK
jgi:T-complex protein 1 subunit theta